MTNTKKRQRTKTDKDKDDKDDNKIVATFCERWDVNMFNSIRGFIDKSMILFFINALDVARATKQHVKLT